MAGDLAEVCLAQGVSPQLGLVASLFPPLGCEGDLQCQFPSWPTQDITPLQLSQWISEQCQSFSPTALSGGTATWMSLVAPDNKGHSVFLENVFSPRQNYTFSMGYAGEKMIIWGFLQWFTLLSKPRVIRMVREQSPKLQINVHETWVGLEIFFLHIPEEWIWWICHVCWLWWVEVIIKEKQAALNFWVR